MSQSSYIKFQPYPVKGMLGGGAEPKLLENALSGGIGMKLGGNSSIRD